MNITYGICVGKEYSRDYLQRQIISIIYNQPNPDGWELILVGQDIEDFKGLAHARVINFDESVKPGWITKKKNIIAEEAKNNVLCIMHDYFFLSKNWLTGVNKYCREITDKWQVLMNEVQTFEGTRHADWQVSPIYMNEAISIQSFV